MPQPYQDWQDPHEVTMKRSLSNEWEIVSGGTPETLGHPPLCVDQGESFSSGGNQEGVYGRQWRGHANVLQGDFGSNIYDDVTSGALRTAWFNARTRWVGSGIFQDNTASPMGIVDEDGNEPLEFSSASLDDSPDGPSIGWRYVPAPGAGPLGVDSLAFDTFALTVSFQYNFGSSPYFAPPEVLAAMPPGAYVEYQPQDHVTWVEATFNGYFADADSDDADAALDNVSAYLHQWQSDDYVAGHLRDIPPPDDAVWYWPGQAWGDPWFIQYEPVGYDLPVPRVSGPFGPVSDLGSDPAEDVTVDTGWLDRLWVPVDLRDERVSKLDFGAFALDHINQYEGIPSLAHDPATTRTEKYWRLHAPVFHFTYAGAPWRIVYPSTVVPPLRQYPRDDSLAVGTPRLWPPPQSQQHSPARLDGYF